MSRIGDALAAAGATLKRSKKHLVYELPNGKNVVVAATPSDVRAELNMVRDVKRAAGAVPQAAPVGARRGKAYKPGRATSERWGSVGRSVMADAFSEAGLIERQLREENARLARELIVKNALLTIQEERIVVLEETIEQMALSRIWKAFVRGFLMLDLWERMP